MSSTVLVPRKQRRRLEALLSRQGQSALAAAVLVGGGGYAYLRVQQAAAVARRRKLRTELDQGNGGDATASASGGKAVAARRPAGKKRNLQQLLRMLLSIAGPKIFALIALAVARTTLSNRLARLQVWHLHTSCETFIPVSGTVLHTQHTICHAMPGGFGL